MEHAVYKTRPVNHPHHVGRHLLLHVALGRELVGEHRRLSRTDARELEASPDPGS